MTPWTNASAMDPMDGRRRCTGTNRAGNRCGRAPAKGAKVCSFHGGKAPQVARKAKERHVEEQVRKMAEQYVPNAEPVADPLMSLLKLAGEIEGFKDFIAARVAEMRADSWRYEGEHAEQLRAELSLYERALDRTGKVLVDINKLGLEERQVRLAEREGTLLAEVLRRIFDRLGLTVEQRSMIPTVVPEELRRAADTRRAIAVPSADFSPAQGIRHRSSNAVSQGGS